MKIDEVSQLA